VGGSPVSSDDKIGIKDTNGTVKFLLSSGPVAWLLLGIGVLAWGLKLEARIEAHETQSERRLNYLEVQDGKDFVEHTEFNKQITRLQERQEEVFRRLEKMDRK
jgi:hypothetical protein